MPKKSLRNAKKTRSIKPKKLRKPAKNPTKLRLKKPTKKLKIKKAKKQKFVKPKLKKPVRNYLTKTQFKKQVKRYRLKQASSKKPVRGALGQIRMKIEFRKGRHRFRSTGYSYLFKDYSKESIKRHQNQAFKHALAQAPFSPDSYKVLSTDFVYFKSSIER